MLSKRHILNVFWRLVMESNTFSVPLGKNPLIAMKVTPGHFSTNRSHITHFLDLNDMKSNIRIARDAARELAAPYLATLIETIVCMEGTEVVGAYLAEELLQEGMAPFNNDGEIHVLTPIRIANGNFIFQGSTVEWISGRHVLLLVPSISSGSTVNRALDCILFYGGVIAGISALFRTLDERYGKKINALFTSEDVPGYMVWDTHDCEMCKAGRKLDAMVSSEGYTEFK
jgi:orotate phosphoribosyltransferase